MKVKLLFILVILLCVASATATSTKPSARAATVAQATSGAQDLSADQMQGLKDDLARMKALVQQMETNLSFVDTSQSPLKHQFQLEIDMWRMMIRQMERKLGKSK